jgi:hypothetical protein
MVVPTGIVINKSAVCLIQTDSERSSVASLSVAFLPPRCTGVVGPLSDTNGIGAGIRHQNVDMRGSRDRYFSGNKIPKNLRAALPGQ